MYVSNICLSGPIVWLRYDGSTESRKIAGAVQILIITKTLKLVIYDYGTLTLQRNLYDVLVASSRKNLVLLDTGSFY